MDDDEEDEDEDSDNRKPKRDEAEKKRARQEQKQMLKDRKAAKTNAGLISESKKVWEKLRLKRIDTNERSELMAKMMALITGKVNEVTFKHDMARMVQCALKYGNSDQRDIIANELSGTFVKLSSSQYGRFIVSKILNFCPNYRSQVIKELKGHVKQLIFHAHAGPVIEEAWSQFAKAQERVLLIEEFYGPEFVLFKSTSPDKYSVKTLDALFEAHPEKRPSVVDHLRATLESLLSKPSTPMASSSLLHRLLFDYLTVATPAHAALLISTTLRDRLPLLVHTRDGARVAQLVLLHSSPKDRKLIVRSFKGLVARIAREPFGHAVLLTLFECVDDTVLVGKHILSELAGGVTGAPGEDGEVSPLAAELAAAGESGPSLTPAQLLRDAHGARVALFLLVGRNTRHQEGYVLKELASDDVLRKLTSKKNDVQRAGELRAIFAPQILGVAVNHLPELIRTVWGARVLCELLRCPEAGDKSRLIEGVAALTAGTIESHLAANPKPLPASAVISGVKDEKKKKEVFNAGRKMAQEAKAEKEKLAQQKAEAAAAASDPNTDPTVPVDLSLHVLVHRTSTFCIKEMIAGVRASSTNRRETVIAADGGDSTDNANANGAASLGADSGDAHNTSATDRKRKLVGGSVELAYKVWSTVRPEIGYWLRYCAADHRGTSGTAFVLLAAVEGVGNEAAHTLVESGVTVAELERMIGEQRLASSIRVDGKAENGNKNKKRKVQQGGETAGSSGIELLLAALKKS
ncbi:armadillo-type protein [Zopfochytrium polystomum]|nr:armadillo-type protein [Zopfochytrium polystomum]